MAANSHKTLGKRSHIESSLESVSSDQSNLIDITKDSFKVRMAHLDFKRKKLEIGAEERALLLKQQMQEKELAYKERIMQYELELTRLKMQIPATAGAHPIGFGPEGHSTNTYPPSDNFSQDSFVFGAGTMSSMLPLPSLSSGAWGSPQVSMS